MFKKILMLLAILVSGFIGFLVISVGLDLYQEELLKKEITNLVDTYNENFDLEDEEFQKYLNRTVTKQDYKKVEKAVKSYLLDFYTLDREMDTVVEKEALDNILSHKNYQKDKNFTDSREYLKNQMKKLYQLDDELKEFATSDKINSYISDLKLDTYYIDIYYNLLKEEFNYEDELEIIDDYMTPYFSTLEKVDQLLIFLNNYSNDWEIRDNNLCFFEEDVMDAYNDIKGQIGINLELTYEKDFGTYRTMNGFVRNDKVIEGDEEEYDGMYMDIPNTEKEYPNYITINYYSFGSSSEDSDKMIAGLDKTIKEDAAKYTNVTLEIEHFRTINDLPVCGYRFIDKESNNFITRYYVLGDKEAILVISNSQDGSRTIDNAALRLVESFRFNNKNQDKDNL